MSRAVILACVLPGALAALSVAYLALRVVHGRRDARRARLARWVFWQVRDHGGRITAEEIAAQAVWFPPFRLRKDEVETTMRRMLASGRLEGTADGRIALGVTYEQ